MSDIEDRDNESSGGFYEMENKEAPEEGEVPEEPASDNKKKKKIKKSRKERAPQTSKFLLLNRENQR